MAGLRYCRRSPGFASFRAATIGSGGGWRLAGAHCCLLLALLIVTGEGAPSGAGRSLSQQRGVMDKSDPLCTAEWTFSQCVPINNKCGRGYKLGTRAGELCRLLKDLFYCTVDCVEEGGKVHVDALFNRTKRGPHHAAAAASKPPARLTAAAAANDYRAHVPGSQYSQGGCTYRVGRWQNCSMVQLTKRREDRLVATASGSSAGSRCLLTKTVEMDCTLLELEPAKCRYEAGKWSKCDMKTRKRTQLKTLSVGNPAYCSTEIRVQRPCYTKTGEERCFYGQWSEWGPCANSVKMKRRKVLYGQSCDRTTRTASCHPRSTGS